MLVVVRLTKYVDAVDLRAGERKFGSEWKMGKARTANSFIRFALLSIMACAFGFVAAIDAMQVIADQPAADGENRVDYLTQVKPLLHERCYACHGGLKQESGLRLDTVKLILKGGDSGSAIVPNAANESELLKRVATKDISERMPPEHEGEPLNTSQIELLTRWIAEGATGPEDEEPEADPSKHWSFQPIIRPDVPSVNSGTVRNPIDAFVEVLRRQHAITAQDEAPENVLLRRLYLDLVGVPPNNDEIRAFANDPAPDRYEQLVERLLEDPRHGERWARHWMDIWRYSDWWGLGDQLRNSQKHIWHWRDWIIDSLNNDVPYDEMVRLMLAADELHPNDLDKLRATGYLARNYFLFNRPQWMEETVEHVSKGFLGLTMNCAKCHDHKFDPLEQNDFYRMRAFFEPYHVRLDLVPGTTDVAVDGIPRAFDREPDAPTYRYIRGDEKNPDKSEVIAPAVPSILAFDELAITPVQLPIEAWRPGYRPWIAQTYLKAAEQRIASAEGAVQKADGMLAERQAAAKTAAPEKSQQVAPEEGKSPQVAPSVIVSEKFESLDAAIWKTFGGEWVHTLGALEQKQDGASRSTLRLLKKVPRNFDATIQFTTLGGSQWRSVGLSFDVSQADPTLPPAATDSLQTVYVSAFAGGSKVQASYQRGSQSHYPPGDAVRSMPISLNLRYTLRVQVRDSLVNVTLDGNPVIAWQSPVERREGAFELMTFDALAILHEVHITELAPDVALRSPSANSPTNNKPMSPAEAVVDAQSEVAIAEAALTLAKADHDSIVRRAAAQEAERIQSNNVPAEGAIVTPDSLAELVKEAVRAERLAAVAKERHVLAVAEQSLLRAAVDKREAAEKAVSAAREALAKVTASAEAEIAESDQYTRLTGAHWSPTRFLNSGKDDPAVEFVSTSTGRRTALAKWITDRRNPLTARVAANHIWTRHLGQPLVPTVFDFGRKGTPPTHPELLDWLAAELIDSGWSMKHLHRLIVNSTTYRLSSSVAGAESSAAADPENRLLWRRLPLRIESQVVRDTLLSLAGSLDPTIGGPSVPTAQQLESNRRSLYFFHSNNERNLFLTTFDEALVKDCYRREQSIVPQQALALTNSRLVIDSSQKIANRISSQASDDKQFVHQAFELLLAIKPSDEEVAACMDSLEKWTAIPNASRDSARANLIWTLINHNDFVTLR